MWQATHTVQHRRLWLSDGAAVGPPVLHGLGHMAHFGRGCTRQVGNGARHLQRTVRAAGRPAQAGSGGVEEFGGGILQVQVGVDLLALQRLVGLALPRQCHGAGLRHAFADRLAGFARGCLHQLVGGQGGHLHMQVNAVQQRAAELGLVAVHLVGRAAARALGGAQVAARAGVHGRNHLEPGGEIRTLRRSGDGDVSCLQRFTQGLQRSARKLGH